MGEREDIRREAGEIVAVYRRPFREQKRRDPREVVSVYRQRDPREVVETYRRSAPGLFGGRKLDWTPALAVWRPLLARRRKRNGLRRFLVCLAALAGLAAAAQMLPEPRIPDFPDFEVPVPSKETEITIPDWPVGLGARVTVSREHGGQMTAQEVYRQVNPSVVTVLAGLGGNSMSVGTGVIFTEDGYLVTNHHVIEGGQDCSVLLDSGYRLTACYVAGDAENDLAVLKIPPGELEDLGALPTAQFGDSDLLSVGDPVYAIGNPLGWELRGTLTDGIVSAINRDVEVDGRTMNLIQTNAALNSGNSGGPLINAYGQVVGINVIKMRSDHSTVEGLGFAIPSARMERIVNDLLEWGALQPEPRLGITVRSLATVLEDGRRGLLVEEVSAGTAAERAGVRTGDYVLAADGEALSSTDDLFRIRRRLHVGDQLELTLWRNGEIFEVQLFLEEAV